MNSAMAALRVLAVIGLLAGFLWWLRRYDRRTAHPARRRGRRPVEILGQARLSRQATVAVVRVGERSLTLGVTDHGVNLLAEADYVEPEVSDEDVDEARPSFAAALQLAVVNAPKLLSKTTARTEGTVQPEVKTPPARKPEQRMTA